MTARYTDVLVVIGAQSQAVHALTGGGEPVDTPMSGRPPAAERLRSLLAAWMPGVTVTVAGAVGPGPATYTAVGNTGLLRTLTGGTAFWDDTTNAFDTHGLAQRDYILARAGASRLCIFVHWSQTQDAGSSLYSNSLYATNLVAYYNALIAACGPSFAEFRILTLMAGSRSGLDDVAVRLGGIRRIVDAVAGVAEPFSGASRIAEVLRPMHAVPSTPAGAYVPGSGDFNHMIRSAAWRFAGHVATQVALHNGFVPPVVSPPRLCAATLVNPSTLRAIFVSPAKLPLVQQGTLGFRLTAGSILGQASLNNTQVASTGYATLDLTVSGVTPGARLQWQPDMLGYSSFVNGTAAPRGQLSRALWANPGATPAITDAAEDLAGSDVCLFAEVNQAGVPIDIL